LSRLRLVCLACLAIATLLSAFAITVPPQRAEIFNEAAQRSVDLRDIQTDWARADAIAVSSIDPAASPSLIDAFNAAMGDVHRGVLNAVRSHQTDFEELVALSQTAMAYQDLVEAAWRTDPAGAGGGFDQLAEAHRMAQDGLNGQLTTLIERADLDSGPGTVSPLLTIALIASWSSVALLILVMAPMARRTHRLLNLGLIGAMAALLVMATMLSVSAQRFQRDTDQAAERIQAVRLIYRIETEAWSVAAADCLAIRSPNAFNLHRAEASQHLAQAEAELDALERSPLSHGQAWSDLRSTLAEIRSTHDNLSPNSDPAEVATAFRLDSQSPWQRLVQAGQGAEAELVWLVDGSGFNSGLGPYIEVLLPGVLAMSLTLVGFRIRLRRFQ
jgi:hypothetical protein